MAAAAWWSWRWLLPGSILVLTVAGVVWWWNYRRNAYRRAALRDLEAIAPQLYDEKTRREALARIAILLKRTALLVYPREQVAPLSGAAWLVFLAETSGEADFKRRLGQMFVAAVFNPSAASLPTQEECEQIAALARGWILKHRRFRRRTIP